MTVLPWFRMYAADALLSADLQELTPLEFRAWFRLLCIASLSDQRWHVPAPTPSLAHRLLVSPAQIGRVLEALEVRGMITREPDGAIVIASGERFNPPASSEPQAAAARQRMARARRSERGAKPLDPEICHSDVTVTSRARTEQNRTEKNREEQNTAAAAAAASLDTSPAALPVTPELRRELLASLGRGLDVGAALSEARARRGAVA